VRRKYDEVGLGADVPPELPRPLRVGQEVTARHPVTRQLHDGVILTIKGPMYRWVAESPCFIHYSVMHPQCMLLQFIVLVILEAYL
jgi:hypothetical protein